MTCTAILDIGKTNVKLLLLDEEGATMWSRSRGNQSVVRDPYPYYDVEVLWQWLLDCLREAAADFTITAINLSTHGACAALLDAQGELALPVMDYEYDGVEACNDAYARVRPAFADTLSPGLPSGLNLGRQLFWQREQFPEAFAGCASVLMYPQYWAWRLTGILATEVTSLGCHTDLWNPLCADFSGLVDELALRERLPPLVAATKPLGVVEPWLAESLGLPRDCAVFPGVHDSNASFARYLAAGLQPPFAVVSTGTWVVSMAAGVSVDALDEKRDTLANVNVLGQPLACARFMGGREFEAICQATKANTAEVARENQVAELVRNASYPLPAFASGSGPFAGRSAELPHSREHGNALATLYLALMIDYELDLLGAPGDVLFGSSSHKNPLLCRLLAQLRPAQRVLMSGDEASTVRGAWCLTRWDYAGAHAIDFERALSTNIPAFIEYRDQWRRRAEQ